MRRSSITTPTDLMTLLVQRARSCVLTIAICVVMMVGSGSASAGTTNTNRVAPASIQYQVRRLPSGDRYEITLRFADGEPANSDPAKLYPVHRLDDVDHSDGRQRSTRSHSRDVREPSVGLGIRPSLTRQHAVVRPALENEARLRCLNALGVH
jgi:hypothetical protein